MAKYAQGLAKTISRDRMKQKIDHMVEKFKGLRWVQQVKKGGRIRRHHCMVYPNGKAATKLKGMANVFRKFYEELYASKDTSTNSGKTIFQSKQTAKLPRVTFKEVDKALEELQNGKCKDTKYVTAEIIKYVGIETNKVIAIICCDIIRGGEIQ